MTEQSSGTVRPAPWMALIAPTAVVLCIATNAVMLRMLGEHPGHRCGARADVQVALDGQIGSGSPCFAIAASNPARARIAGPKPARSPRGRIREEADPRVAQCHEEVEGVDQRPLEVEVDVVQARVVAASSDHRERITRARGACRRANRQGATCMRMRPSAMEPLQMRRSSPGDSSPVKSVK